MATRIEPAVYAIESGAARGRRISPIVERRALRPLTDQPSVRIANLPSPGADLPRVWLNRAGWDIRLKRYRRVRGPVRLILTFERAPRGRLDLLTRAVIDLLSATSLIDGDDAGVVKELILSWGVGKGLQIIIEPWSERGPTPAQTAKEREQ